MRTSEELDMLDVSEMKPKHLTKSQGKATMSMRGFIPLQLGRGMPRLELAGRRPGGRAERRFMDVKFDGAREDGR